MTVLQIRPVVCQGKHTCPPGTCACVFVRLIKKKRPNSLIHVRRANICPGKSRESAIKNVLQMLLERKKMPGTSGRTCKRYFAETNGLIHEIKKTRDGLTRPGNTALGYNLLEAFDYILTIRLISLAAIISDVHVHTCTRALVRSCSG